MATFYNQATLSYSGGTVNSNMTSGEILEVLSATKTAVIDTYTQGEQITYAIQIINSGTSPFSALTISDNLGAYSFDTTTLTPLEYIEGSVKYYINGILQSAPTVTAGPPLIITGISVPANGVATILYIAQTNTYASPLATGIIENTATITGSGITNLTITETITAENAPSLTITKGVNPSVITENGSLTYTFVVQNFGNAPASAEDNIVISDTFEPLLNNITVSYNATSWSTPANYTYNETTGEFSTVAGEITVPAATYTQDSTTGIWQITPGVATVTVSGTI